METEEITTGGINNRPVATEDKTCCGRLKHIIKHTTVEPSAFLIMFGSILQSVATQTLGLQKACRVSLELGDEICDALRIQNQTEDFSVYERMVQELYSAQIAWKSILQTVLPCTVIIFVGGWSDATGRRRAIMIACVCGEIAHSLNNILNVVFFSQIPLQAYVSFEVFTVSIVGGSSVMFLAVLNYICDITTEENRTYRMGFVSLCTFAAIPLGLSLSGVVLNIFGYYSIFCTALALHLINLLYIIFLIKENPRTKEQKMHDGKGFIHFLKTFFNLGTIKETLAIIWKKTDNNRRKTILILLACVSFLFGPFFGENVTIFMFTRYRFNWDEIQFSIYQTYSFIISILGSMISLLLFSKYLKWHDSVLGITACTSKILSSFVYCFAPTTGIFYLAPLVDILSGAMLPLLAVRSIYTKLMSPNELGKTLSLLVLVENLTPLIYVPIYTSIYTATMDTLPGALYLFGAAMTIPGLIAFIYLFRLHRAELKEKAMA